MGSPVVNECDGDHHYDTHKRQLQWRLPFIDSSNKAGSLEFNINSSGGVHPEDFFPVTVSFVSKKPYCDIAVSSIASFSHDNSCNFVLSAELGTDCNGIL